MARLSFLLLVLPYIFSCAYALNLSGRVQWNDICPGSEALRPSKVILDNGRMMGNIMRDGRFIIPDVPAGTYILSVLSPDYSFDQLRVDITDSDAVPHVRPYAIGTPLNPASTVLLSHPITLIPRQKNVYFIPPESFSLVAMFSNPMMLLMVFAGVMMLATPYLMKNMDPESMEEFKEQHAKVTRMQHAIANGDPKSGIASVLGNDEPPHSTTGPSSSIKPSTPIKPRGGNKNKKR